MNIELNVKAMKRKEGRNRYKHKPKIIQKI